MKTLTKRKREERERERVDKVSVRSEFSKSFGHGTVPDIFWGNISANGDA